MAKAIWSCVIVVVPLLLITNLTGTHPNPMQPVFCEPDSGYTGDDPRIRQVLDFAGAVSFHHTVIPNVAVVLTFSPRIGFTSEHAIDPGPIRFVIEPVVDISGIGFTIKYALNPIQICLGIGVEILVCPEPSNIRTIYKGMYSIVPFQEIAVVDTHDVIPGRLFCIQFAFAGEVVMQLAIGA